MFMFSQVKRAIAYLRIAHYVCCVKRHCAPKLTHRAEKQCINDIYDQQRGRRPKAATPFYYSFLSLIHWFFSTICPFCVHRSICTANVVCNSQICNCALDLCRKTMLNMKNPAVCPMILNQISCKLLNIPPGPYHITK